MKIKIDQTFVTYTLEEIKSMKIPKEELDRLDAMTDDDIDYSDIPKLTKDQLAQFKPARFADRFKKTEAEIEAISDDLIDTSDIPELDDEYWAEAKLIIPETDEIGFLPVPAEILSWFKDRSENYGSEMNAVLREFIGQARKTLLFNTK